MAGDEPGRDEASGGWLARLPTAAQGELVRHVAVFSHLSADVLDTARVVDLESQFLDEDPGGAAEHLTAQAGHLRRAARSQDQMADALEAMARFLREHMPPPSAS